MSSPEPLPRRVTIVDVARLADVTVTTAGRALTGNGAVSDLVLASVRAAARELGYVAPGSGKKR